LRSICSKRRRFRGRAEARCRPGGAVARLMVLKSYGLKFSCFELKDATQ
jgi:hypothetical protein